MMNNIKKIIINISFTAYFNLLLLAVFAYFFIPEPKLEISTFFQILVTHIIIHLGFIGIKKIKYSFTILEYLVDISFILLVTIVSGIINDWFSGIPIFYCIVIVFVIYIVTVLLSIFRVHKEAGELNKLLKNYKDKSTKTVR